MNRSPVRRWVSASLLALGLASCGAPVEPPPRQAYDYYPASSTPEGAIQRFLAVYQERDLKELSQLFTADYAYEFSEGADPYLIAKYATSAWTGADEMISTRNLFLGGVSAYGESLQPVEDLSLKMSPTKPVADASDGKDPAAYQVLETVVELESDMFETTGCVGPGSAIVPQLHRFFLVRGDHAGQLGPGQVADDLHWYIYRWQDETSGALPGSDGPRPVSWGSIKDLYR